MSTKTTTKAKSKAKKLRKLSIKRPYGTLKCIAVRQSGVLGPSLEGQRKGASAPAPEKPEEKISLVQAWNKKAGKGRRRAESIKALCRFPDGCENRPGGAALVLLVLLCQAAPFLLGDIPAMPVILLPADSQAAAPWLHALLTAIQGPEVWKGEDWKLERPWYIKPRPALMETDYSSYIVDYIGGNYKEWDGRKRRFWFPYIGSAVILGPGLPVQIQKAMLEQSTSTLTIVFGQPPKGTARWTLPLLQENFQAYDMEAGAAIFARARDIHQEVVRFLRWFAHSKKRRRQWQADRERFRPVTRRGRFSQPQADAQTDLLCTALSLFKQFLSFCVEVTGRISPETAQEFLMEYWRLVLPQSAPAAVLEGAAPEGGSSAQTYDSPAVFFRFLTDYYLPTYQKQFCIRQRGTPGTMGLIWDLHEAPFLILPRREALDAYSHWLGQQGVPSFSLSKKNEAADVQRALREAGVPLLGEKNDPATWRFQFYEKSSTEALPEGKGKIPCLSLALPALPDQVRTRIGDLFGIAADTAGKPNPSDPGSEPVERR